jgi:hypothetical protein
VYKQRGTKEARRRRYERLYDVTHNYTGYNRGPGKKHAGTKANKKQAKHTRHACLKDWAKPHTTMAHVQRTNALKFYTISELNIDAANGSKPNHQARAVDIAKCFPQIVLGAKDEGTLVENLLKKFGR